MPTPLYDALRKYAHQTPQLRMHMPGHKGRPLSKPEFATLTPLDVTELSITGNLYQRTEPFISAQALWAVDFGFENCQFLTGGSTQGVYTALDLCCPPGSTVLLDRASHRSAFHAMALLDLHPIYLERSWLRTIAGPIAPEEVERALTEHPDIQAVFLTSPTYYGVLSDVPAIAQLAHAHGIRLIIDGAHGAHLPFLGLDAAFSGADVVTTSAHKTLPALGQAALLFTNGFDPDLVRSRAALYGTSSPSYPILASMDIARDYMEGSGASKYRWVARRALQLQKKFSGFQEELPIDPCRLSVVSKNGILLAKGLEEQGVFAELADTAHVLFILTCADGKEELDRLDRTLESYAGLFGEPPAFPLPPPLPEQALSIREALFSPSVSVPFEAGLGRIAADSFAPYPPGIPVVAPGERIGTAELSYVRQMGYHSQTVSVVIE